MREKPRSITRPALNVRGIPQLGRCVLTDEEFAAAKPRSSESDCSNAGPVRKVEPYSRLAEIYDEVVIDPCDDRSIALPCARRGRGCYRSDSYIQLPCGDLVRLT